MYKDLRYFVLYFFRIGLGTSMKYQVPSCEWCVIYLSQCVVLYTHCDASGWGALAPQPMVVTQSSNVMNALGLSLLNLSNPFCILLNSSIPSACLIISYNIASSFVNTSDCPEYGLVLLYILLSVMFLAFYLGLYMI